MSYKALYRTYRPQKFDEVAGQKQIIQTLQNAIKDNKIAHAYLFTGPRGTGKTTMAKLLAKALNCTDTHTKPCNECDVCKAINDGSFADVIEIDAASNNGVDEVRSLIDKVKYAPIEGKYKVYIIDEVHMMSQGAFNALLKTLEEPPAHVIFVLATTEPHKVLPTILSRCQRFDFGRISNNDIKSRLEDVLNSENIEYDSEVIDLVSDLCDGGMRDALSILDQTIAYAGDTITAQDVREIYGIVSNEEKIQFINMILDNQHQELLNCINNFDQRGVDIARLTNNLIDLLKESIIYNGSNSFRGLKVLNENNINDLMHINNSKAFDMIDVLVEALSSYRRAGAPRTLFEIACLKMCNLTDYGAEKVIYKEVVKEVPVVKSETTKEKSTVEAAAIKENYEIKEKSKSVELSEKEKLGETKQETQLNVSHETTTNTTYEFKQEKETEEDLLNVLVQASKDALLKAKQQWIMLPKYLNTPSTAKIAGILLDGYPLAACDNVIILGYNNDVYLNRVYDGENYDEMNNFVKALYNSDVKCYCLTVQSFNALREKYLALRQLGKLPKPVPIVIQRRSFEKKKEVTVDKDMEYAKQLFGDSLIVKED